MVRAEGGMGAMLTWEQISPMQLRWPMLRNVYCLLFNLHAEGPMLRLSNENKIAVALSFFVPTLSKQLMLDDHLHRLDVLQNA